jgi:hypothetical protein
VGLAAGEGIVPRLLFIGSFGFPRFFSGGTSKRIVLPMTTIPAKQMVFGQAILRVFRMGGIGSDSRADGFRSRGCYRVPDRRKSDVVDESVIGKSGAG